MSNSSWKVTDNRLKYDHKKFVIKIEGNKRVIKKEFPAKDLADAVAWSNDPLFESHSEMFISVINCEKLKQNKKGA